MKVRESEHYSVERRLDPVKISGKQRIMIETLRSTDQRLCSWWCSGRCWDNHFRTRYIGRSANRLTLASNDDADPVKNVDYQRILIEALRSTDQRLYS